MEIIQNIKINKGETELGQVIEPKENLEDTTHGLRWMINVGVYNLLFKKAAVTSKMNKAKYEHLNDKFIKICLQ